ncbi:MAG: sigma-54-dependent transcriptional regulator [Deltaproteobacteria bacterium]
MARTLLIADDEDDVLDLLRNVFTRPDLRLLAARSGKEACRLIDREDIDVVLTDLVMPDGDGLSVLSHVKKTRSNAEVILLTGFGTVENAVQAMKLGAFHYVRKPFKVADVSNLVDRALELSSVKKENVKLKNEVLGRHRLDSVIGVSDPMRQVLSLVEKVSATDSTILILGESGTGKELVAQAIHYNSKRADRMLVPVNCAAIPSELLESELFGHVKGAYTGAHIARAGRFETADGGTIFLDEIAEMPAPLQAKLLRVLQEQSFIPVGGTKTVEVDVRVIAATNRDLDKEIAAGRFRQDLYYRLNVIPIRLPPLRERPDDVAVLADHFLRKWNRETGRTLAGFSPDALDCLMRYAWPGNVRELENLVERLVVLKRSGRFDVKDLPPAMVDGRRAPAGAPATAGERIDFRQATAAYEDNLIREALRMAGGNRNRAAGILGLKRTTFLEMLKRKAID